MNEKAIDNNGNGILVLILPIALLIVFLFTTWRVLLALIVLSISWNFWQRYRWQKWSQQVNPIFHQLIQQNQGRITELDLAMKANFSAEIAKRYLNSKVAEFGARTLDYEDKGKVYYFITAKSLGSIFDESEPESEPNQHDQRADSQEKQGSVQVAENKQLQSTAPSNLEASVTSEASAHLEDEAKPQDYSHLTNVCLIQSELAKRLDVHSSTVYKRRDDPDFAQWTKSRDPEGIAWKFLSETKLFSPLEKEGST